MIAIRTALVSMILLSAAAAQHVCWEHVGIPNQSWITSQGPALIGDADRDGWRDLVTLVSAELAPGQYELQLWTISGQTGDTLRRLPGPSLGAFQRVISAGDIDDDGCDDYAIGVANTRTLVTTMEVRSGLDDSLLWSIRGSWLDGFGSYASIGDLDLDGDGKPDLVVSAPLAHPLGELRAFANGGTPLWVINGTFDVGFGLKTSGKDLGRMGDVDDDGCDDFVAGGGGPGGSGAGVVISGRTGKVLTVGYGDPGDQLGFSASGAGDVDADGIPDFAVGNWGDGFRGGTVAVFSGVDGRRIREWTSADVGIGFSADSLLGGLDIDVDGVPDVIVGAPLFGPPGPYPGGVFVFSGRDGSEIYRWENQLAYTTGLGVELVAIGEVPDSMFPRFAVTEDQYGRVSGPTQSNQGRITALCGGPPAVDEIGFGCRGAVERAPRIGFLHRGDSVRIHLSHAPPGAGALLALGLSASNWSGQPLPISLSPLGLSGCELLTSIEAAIPVMTGTSGIERGYAYVDVPAPLGNQLGVTLHGQWIVSESDRFTPAAVSGALSWTH